jgi:hypothetical protein
LKSKAASLVLLPASSRKSQDLESSLNRQSTSSSILRAEVECFLKEICSGGKTSHSATQDITRILWGPKFITIFTTARIVPYALLALPMRATHSAHLNVFDLFTKIVFG